MTDNRSKEMTRLAISALEDKKRRISVLLISVRFPFWQIIF